MNVINRSCLIAIVAILSSTQLFAGEWKSSSEMPTGRQELYATSAQGMIFIPGGILNDVVTTTAAFEAFDAKANKWQQLSPLPLPRHHITPVAINGKIYAMGGFDGPFPEWAIRSEMFVYDIQNDTWEKGTSLPESRGEHVAVVVDGKIHVIGGRVQQDNGTNHFDSYIDSDGHRVYDPNTGKWQAAAPALTARNSAAAAVIDGLIYVVGGRANVFQEDGTQLQQNLGTLEVYNPKTDSWRTLAPMPEASGGIAASTLDGKLYVFGGEQWAPEKKVFASTWIYDSKTNKWEKGVDMPTGRHGLAAATIGETIYAIGGCTVVGGGAVVGTTEVLVP